MGTTSSHSCSPPTVFCTSTSAAENSTYKKRISAALVEVQNTVGGEQLCEDVVGTLTEFSMYYRELLDKVVSVDKEDGDWAIPLAGSAPCEELLKMTRAWRDPC